MAQSLTSRMKQLRRRVKMPAGPGYIAVSQADYDAGRLPTWAAGLKIYVGISPDEWDNPEEKNDHEHELSVQQAE